MAVRLVRERISVGRSRGGGELTQACAEVSIYGVHRVANPLQANTLLFLAIFPGNTLITDKGWTA